MFLKSNLFTGIIIFFFIQNLFADVLLIPHENAIFSEYYLSCKKNGFQCSQEFLFNQVQMQDTPLFNQFINQLDYSSENFRTQFSNRIIEILKNENISLLQVEMILQIIQQFKELESSPNHQMVPNSLLTLEKQIQQIYNFVKENRLAELNEDFLVILKTPISIQNLKNQKPSLLRLNSIPIQFSKNINQEKLLTGSCDHPNVNLGNSEIKYQLYFNSPCNFNDKFSKLTETTGHFIENNKTTLGLSLLAAGAILFFNKYEIKITF